MLISLFIATPAYSGLTTTQYVSSILSTWTLAREAGIGVSWNTCADSLITRARNILAARFLHSEATHLFFIDADIGFHFEQVIQMLKFDQDFVAGGHPLKFLPTVVGVGKKCVNYEQQGRFVTADHVGCGFMLLKREVIERMLSAYPEGLHKNPCRV